MTIPVEEYAKIELVRAFDFEVSTRATFEKVAPKDLVERARSLPGEWVIHDPIDDADGWLLVGHDLNELLDETIREKELVLPEGKRTLLWHTELGGFPISLYQQGQGFMVVYGLQASQNLNYSEAALELGTSIMHAIKCEGK